MRNRMALAAAFVIGLQGCVTRDASKSERVICVNETARVGSLVRVHSAGRLGDWVEPLVIVSLHGPSTRHCGTNPALPIAARAMPAEQAEERFAKQRERNFPKKFERVATVGNNDVLPAGILHVATHTFRQLGSDEAAAWLVVNFDRANNKGELSYVVDATAVCANGTVSIAWWTTFREANGAGEVVDSASHTPALKVDKPSPAIGSAVREICAMKTKGGP